MFYGGLILAVLVAFWYMRRHRLPLWQTCDVFAPGIALGHAVGRLGCSGCRLLFRAADIVPWAVTFTNPLAAANVGTPLNVPLHPTQIYESAAEAVILLLLLATESERPRVSRDARSGSTCCSMAISRFIIEFYRGDERGLVFGVLSTSQFISVVLVPLSIVMLIWLAAPAAAGTGGGAQTRRDAPS